MSVETEGEATERPVAGPAFADRLSVRLFTVTVLAVMIAEIMIFVPSVAAFRREWLEAKLEAVSVATLAASFGEGGSLPTPAQEAELLHALGARLVAIRESGTTRLLARQPDLGSVDRKVDLERETALESVGEAFGVLLSDGSGLTRLVGPVGDGQIRAEIVLDTDALRRATLLYSRNVFALSLAIASFTGLLVFGAISWFLLRPVGTMTRAMVRFGARPEDTSRIIVPGRRQDELGLAQRELARMQETLSRTLREQRHLADLGLAVSKINHDLRNILASAQLISDRLSDLPDAQVQRFAPILIRSLDRALGYTQSVLDYGRATEKRPSLRRVALRRLVDEVFETQPAAPGRVDLVNAVPAGIEVDVDPEQFFRVLANLVRNAMQALEGETDEAVIRRVRIDAEELGGGEAVIGVEDTGPGVSAVARENLFRAFRGSTRSGGTGLGLAIAREIVEAHGGVIRLVERREPGARFEIALAPRQPSFA
ncbi:HAMP domain-containing sensor histidine kinase [Aureimonas sp. AU4]|uniref:sensor histidine kinase n=1 Tax=Aureimonas sp. AU4 TaxID=1638163 RepID=UPI0007862F4B|nr:HAMP domain-containing sensor histidine kinase [Aureimonas sp. AU4]